MRRTRTIVIGAHSLSEMFDLPPESRVVAVGSSVDPPMIELVVESDSYDVVEDNASSPRMYGTVIVREQFDRNLGEVIGKRFMRWELL